MEIKGRREDALRRVHEAQRTVRRRSVDDVTAKEKLEDSKAHKEQTEDDLKEALESLDQAIREYIQTIPDNED